MTHHNHQNFAATPQAAVQGDSPRRLSERAAASMLDLARAVGGRLDPRIVTRGSFSDNSLKQKGNSECPSDDNDAMEWLLGQCFFDWYQVTLPNSRGKADCMTGGLEERMAIDAALQWAFGQGLHPGQVCGGHNGYRAAVPILRSPKSKEIVARINSGSTSGIMPNVMLTGGHGACADLAPTLQTAFPSARLSRADVALDKSQRGLFDALLGMARTLAAGNGKLGGVRVIESDRGRTFYLGSRTSTVALRVYEKDKERAAKGVIDDKDIDPDLVRIEWTFRPQSKSKAGMSGLTPGQMIRTSVWARAFMSRAARLMKVTGKAVHMGKQEVAREVREKTLQGAVEHGVHQYAKSFARLAAAQIVERDHGGHYDTAMVEPEHVADEAASIFRRLFDETGVAIRIVGEERLDEARDPDGWRSSYVDEMMHEPGRQEAANERAQWLMQQRIAAVAPLM